MLHSEDESHDFLQLVAVSTRGINTMHRAGGPLTLKLAITVVFVMLLLGFAAPGTLPMSVRFASESWDREDAAKFLDERMDVWFANAKKLRTGEAQTVCVSCHTTIPYVLARP